MSENDIRTEGIICPFCGNHPFTQVEFKRHLTNDCSEYQNTPSEEKPAYLHPKHRR